MQSDYYINLHFNQAVSQRTGYAFKIGDKGCTFHLHCEDLDPTDMLPHIVFNHPNNTCVEGVPEGTGRDYTYTIQGNEFGVCGKTVVDLKFYDSLNATQRISTASFMIEILPDTYTDFEESSSSYADSLERAREEIDAAILELQGAEHDLEEAETDLGNMSEQFAETLQDYIDAFGNTAPINPRGEYDPNEQYVPRDAVEYTAGGKTLTYINRSACTGIAPTDPDHGAEHWQIMIDVSVGGSFSALSDVNVDPQTLADGQVPVYDATGQAWENKTILEDSLTSTATDKALTAAKGKELQDNKQDKELETALTIDGTSKTTVETALSGLNAYSDKLKGQLSNENLLVNPWFTVNQRGVTSGDFIPTNTYAFDRWKKGYSGNGAAAWTLTSNGLSVNTNDEVSNCRFDQPFETSLDATKTYTASALLSDGTIVKGTGKPEFTVTNNDFSLVVNTSFFRISFPKEKQVTIRAVKLELGSISTLENDVVPDYTTELLKCQRYFVRFDASATYTQLGIGISATNDQCTMGLILPVKMRATPSMTYGGSFKVYEIDLYNSYAVTNMSIDTKILTNRVVLILSATGVTAGKVYFAQSVSNNSYIDLSAEL